MEPVKAPTPRPSIMRASSRTTRPLPQSEKDSEPGSCEVTRVTTKVAMCLFPFERVREVRCGALRKNNLDGGAEAARRVARAGAAGAHGVDLGESRRSERGDLDVVALR